MTQPGKTSARKRRAAKAKQKNWAVIGAAVLVPLLIIGGLVFIALTNTTGGSADLPVQISTKAAPANAEPNGRAFGPVDAPIKIEEFVDYQCPACKSYATQIEAGVLDAFAPTGKIRYEIHNFPFKGQDSVNAAEGAYCAAEQNKFWEMHSSIFLSQPAVHGAGVFSDARLVKIAEGVGMNVDTFSSCLDSDKYAEQVDADYEKATERKIESTPTFVINGQPYVGVQTLADLQRIIAEVAPGVDLTQPAE